MFSRSIKEPKSEKNFRISLQFRITFDPLLKKELLLFEMHNLPST